MTPPLPPQPMDTGSGAGASWFSEEALLLGEVRRAVQVLPPAPVIAGYAELVELKSGGQGVVYSATQVSTRRRVAIKLLRADGEQARQRFAREIDLAAGLRHPNVIRVYDSGTTGDGRVYLVMELVEGPSLEEFAKGKAPRQIAALMAQVCEAVGYAHRRGVIHRDLKPDNIVIDADAQPRVLDFGLARVTEPTDIQVTTSGQFVGSLAWASPEHAAGHTELIDTRSDVYCLGVILYKLLTGAFPYDVTGGLKITLDRIVGAQPVPPRQKNAAVDEDMQTIVLTCLAKEPDRRYGSAIELAADLRAYLAGEPIAAQRETAWRSLNRRAKRYRATLVVGGAALVLMAGLLAWSILETGRAQQAKKDAETARAATETALGTAQRREKQALAVANFLTTMLRAADPNQMKKDTGGREVRVIEVLDKAAALIPEKFKDDHVMGASLHGVIGQTYRSLGQLDDAQREQDLALTEAEKTEDDLIISDALFEKAVLLGNSRGKNAEAEPIMRRVVEMRTKLKGADDRATIEAKDVLATQLAGMGQFKEAETLIKDSLERRERRFGMKDGDTISSINNYAFFLRGQGRADEALVYFKKGAEASEEALGPDHPSTLILMGNYGNVLAYLDRGNEAVPILEKVVAGQTRVNGLNHPHTAGAMNQLAGALEWASPPRREEAVAMFRKAIASANICLGPEARNTLYFHNNLAACLDEMGRYDEAIAELQIALAGMEKARGPDHYDTASIRCNLGKCLMESGKLAEAEPVMLRGYEGLKQAYSEKADKVTERADELAELYRKMGKPDEAAAWAAKGYKAAHPKAAK
jgi:tetratricopeptide (TPR) repeat protein/predicted Ser/Thr protein kinase